MGWNWDKKEKFGNLLLYFIIALIIFGTAGIWVPAVIDEFFTEVGYSGITHKNLLQNTTTYFLSICVAASFVRVATIQKSDATNKIGLVFINFAFFTLCVLAAIFNSITIHLNEVFYAEIVCVVGSLFSIFLWWKSNWGSDLMDPHNAFGN
jgi:hypothetical protein